MPPQGAVAGTGGPDRPAARPGLAGASGSWAVALLRARGPAPRVPGSRMLFGTGQPLARDRSGGSPALDLIASKLRV